MARMTLAELAGMLEHLRTEVADISERMAILEKQNSGTHGVNGRAVAKPTPAALETLPVPAPAAITEEELVAISAAIGAYLGVRAHIRQIRLLGTSAWAQQGRVFIQASHMLQG